MHLVLNEKAITSIFICRIFLGWMCKSRIAPEYEWDGRTETTTISTVCVEGNVLRGVCRMCLCVCVVPVFIVDSVLIAEAGGHGGVNDNICRCVV